MLIGIDAGHGRYTSGKRCNKRYDGNETREWVLNSRVANYVQQYLSAYNVNTIRLDDISGNTDIPLSTRCRNANNKKCDLVVSIHHNAGGGNGLETYVWNGSKLPQRTVDVAQTIHNACINATGQRNRGLKRADFAMVRDTYMDACLIEGGFMDHPEDTPRILSEEFAQKYARGIANGIAQYYGLKGGNPQASTPSQSQPSVTTGKHLHLPASAQTWRVYPLDKKPVKGNEKGFLKPAKFGGLDYDIIRFSQPNVAVIQTRDFGTCQIYVASSTGATIN